MAQTVSGLLDGIKCVGVVKSRTFGSQLVWNEPWIASTQTSMLLCVPVVAVAYTFLSFVNEYKGIFIKSSNESSYLG